MTEVPLGRVRDLMCAPDTTLETKNRVWSLLVAHSQDHGGAWTLGAVGVALPPLVRVATALAGGDPDGRDGRADLDAEILAGFLRGLATADPATPALFPRLLRAARQGGLGWLRHQRGADTPIGERVGSAPPPRPWGHPELVLSDAVTAGVITTGEATLIAATRLDRLPPAVYARGAGDSEEAVWKRRRRAEHRLAAWITARTRDTDHTHDPTSAHALNTPTTEIALTRATRPARTPRAGRAAETVERVVDGTGTRRAVNSAATAHRTSCPATPLASPSYPCAHPHPDTKEAA